MCDQTEVSYLEDDVVWVKIGPIWWPGVVKDLEKDEEGKDILGRLKKKPIAVVKFFQEDNYEFVRNLDCIYHYSCRRKDEFIKKGLDKFRTGAPHMKKFPADVTTAESLTNGDVNIINDPKFVPEKKESYSEIFGTGKKKNKKDSEVTPRSRARTTHSLPPYRPITHQRFINKALHGESDHKVKTLIQSNASSEDSSSSNPYKCHVCKFETSRVNVIVAHHRLAHSSKNSINWTASDSRVIRKKPIYKARKLKTKKLFDTSKEDFSDEEVPEPKKRGRKPKDKTKASDKSKSDASVTSPTKRKGKEDAISDVTDSKKPRYTDVLLADWSEDEEEDKKEDGGETKESESPSSKTEPVADDSEIKSENASTSLDSIENANSPENAGKSQGGDKKSCFDFDEEEDGFIGMSNANTYGRKIPRVIPVKDKPELGMDVDMDELFKKKSDSDSETGKEDADKDNGENQNECVEESKNEEKPAGTASRRRRSKASKDEDTKVDAENSLALRRTRRPGAKKSYLNEVIEKIDDDDESKVETAEGKEKEGRTNRVDAPKTEASSSSRRKQDFKNQTMDTEREEMVYSDIVKNEQKPKEVVPERRRGRPPKQKEVKDITAQIDSLLEETKPNLLPSASDSKSEKPGEGKSAATSFSFDYLPTEQPGKKVGKVKTEVKSISRMFSDSIPNAEAVVEAEAPTVTSHDDPETKALQEETTAPEPGQQGKTLQLSGLKLSQGGNVALNRGSIVLSGLTKAGDGAVKVFRQGNAPKECIVIPAGKKDGDPSSDLGDGSPRVKNIKTIKVKPESLPPSLITAGKLKGQTIIHQKSGKYVIVTQPQLGRQRVAPGKVQSGSKVVILTNQLGEQKIITTSGLQQTKFKVDGQKIVAATDSTGEKEATTAQAQPVIKMVPDGKGGIMKQLTVSPKKVILGGTKVLVSGSGSPLTPGNAVQKIALSSAGGAARGSGGDFRLIENYKGSGKTVLIQGNPSPGSAGVVLKSSSVVPRRVTKVVQSPQGLPLKKKPKILMRATTGPGEYVMQTAESPTYVVKQKGPDGKFSTQKILRTEIVNQAKVSPSGGGGGGGTKRFILSGQSSNKKGESYIITTNDAMPGKVIRMRQKIKEVDAAATAKTQKVISKTGEVYTIGPNSMLLPAQGSVEPEPATQVVQVQEPSQQPVLQTQVIAMPGPVGADGNQTYVLVSVDEHGVVQGVDNSVVAYDASGQQDQLFGGSTSAANVIVLNQPGAEDIAPVFSTSSQDILAEALANTNVLDGTISNEMDTVVPSILLPPSIPSSVVQETSITLQKPIMTPLEMPSSVAPDTSGLEPPPLPPTPTDEDVLMEEAEGKKDGEMAGTVGDQSAAAYLDTETFETETGGPETFADAQILHEDMDGQKPAETPEVGRKVVEFFQAEQEYLMEGVPEDQTAPSFQSMPLLNDEPDTSDDAQGAEPIGDQQQLTETQKSRQETEQQTQLRRQQEPPSSTISEGNAGEVPGPEFQAYETDRSKGSDGDEKQGEEEGRGEDEPEKDAGKESHSMPVIADDSSAFDVDPAYAETATQKRFQEETEVSSTTDEYVGKSGAN